ncbi:hypothetical protein F5887DRAFT_1080892 [Amanita rubescens]|nr:hypothetical protein F5887DRAFT_1080892 [Amanita rubescens]
MSPNKARSKLLDLAKVVDRASSKRPSGGSTRYTGDPEPGDAAKSLARPKPRGIFSKNKPTDLAGTSSQNTIQLEVNADGDIQMADPNDSNESSLKTPSRLGSNLQVAPPVLAEIDGDSVAMEHDNDLDGTGVAARPTEQRAKLGRLRRASSVEVTGTSLKRKPIADLNGRSGKKPNSTPHQSNRGSSITSGGVYDDWRDRVNVKQSSVPQGSKSTASSNTVAAPSHLDGISVRERGLDDDEDLNSLAVVPQGPKPLTQSLSNVTGQNDADASTDGNPVSSDALGHGFIVSESNGHQKSPPSSTASQQTRSKSSKPHSERHGSGTGYEECNNTSKHPVGHGKGRQYDVDGGSEGGMNQEHQQGGDEGVEPAEGPKDSNSQQTRSRSSKRSNERRGSDTDYEECSNTSKQPVERGKGHQYAWVDVDDGGSEGSMNREHQQGGDEGVELTEGPKSSNTNSKPGPSSSGASLSQPEGSDPESSGPPFPPLAQRRSPRPIPSAVWSSQPGHLQSMAQASMPVGQLGKRMKAFVGRNRPGNGRAAKGLARNQQRNSAASGGPESQVTHPGAGSRAGSVQLDGTANDVEDLEEANIVRRRFKVLDLPLSAEGLKRWNAVMVPRWMDYVFSVSENPWQPGDLVSDAQGAWDATFSGVDHQVGEADDPVYYLLRQRIYEFRGRIADRAERAVETYFDLFHEDSQGPEIRAEYVEWALPRDKVEKDRFGSIAVVHRPKFVPFLWKRSPDDEGVGGEGPFQHQIILDTFAFFLEAVDHLPPASRQTTKGHFPRAALALAAAAVERALGLWRTGRYTPLSKTRSSKSKPKKSRITKAEWNAVVANRGKAGTAEEITDDSPMFRYGGVVPDGETDAVEAKGIQAGYGQRLKIEEKTVESSKNAKNGAKKWKLIHLPDSPESEYPYSSHVVPLARKKTGTLEPWEMISVDDLQVIVDQVYPEKWYKVETNNVWFGLVRRRCALKVGVMDLQVPLLKGSPILLKLIAISPPNKRFPEMAHLCCVPITVTTHMTYYTWGNWSEDDSKRKGFGLGSLVLYTFANAHLAYLGNDIDIVNEKPIGALLLSMQAVGRALESWKSGVRSDPKDLDEFSKDKYGDKYELSGKGKATKRIRRATLFVKTLQQMKNEDWKYLIKEAREWIDKTRVRATSTASASTLVEETVFEDATEDFVMAL